MLQFSANLGFLWTEYSLPDAIRAAYDAGFDAVECHFPYAESTDDVIRALADTRLKMLGLNTIKGPLNAGLAALPDQVTMARRAIDQAVEYAHAIACPHVHVMAGQIQGDLAETTYLDNLRYASDQAAKRDLTIVIEPLNPFDMPRYFLRDTSHALAIIEHLNRGNVALMFDCYHVGRTEGDILARFDACYSQIGHIQFAAVPDRGPPDTGAVDYAQIFAHIADAGWASPLGAEYRVDGTTDATLHWLTAYHAHSRDT
jgi:hydroxypyruvate isomerase